MGRLDVRVVAARNLPDTQMVSKPDPYVILKLENQPQHRTSVIEDELNPQWDEVFKFTVADENTAQLKLELWNSNVVKDEYLGEYALSLAGLTRGVVKDDWYLLKHCKSNAEIRVRVLAVDFGADPPPATVEAEQLHSGPLAPLPYVPPPGYMQPFQPAPPPPPQRFEQPQWGNVAPGEKCEVKDKKKGLGGFVSALGSVAKSAASALTGPATAKDAAPPPNTFIDDATGYMYLNMDRGLRLIPSAEVYCALFNHSPAEDEFQHFTGPHHPALRILAPLPPTTRLFRAGRDGAIYMLDVLPPQCVEPCRRLIHESAWGWFRFGTSSNLTMLTLEEAQRLPDGDPIHAPMA